MKLAMAQMSMTGSMDENLKKSLAFCDAAAGSDLLFFPEVQLTPFFPQYAGRNADAYVVPAAARRYRPSRTRRGRTGSISRRTCTSSKRANAMTPPSG